MTNRIRASVTAHYLETGRACTLPELARRLGEPTPGVARAAMQNCMDLIWIEVDGVSALEPTPDLLGRVLGYLGRCASVQVRPVRVVGVSGTLPGESLSTLADKLSR